jgi:hypothetical protein
MSFVAHVVMITGSDSILAQLGIEASGLLIMTAVAYYRGWPRQVDQPNLRGGSRVEGETDYARVVSPIADELRQPDRHLSAMTEKAAKISPLDEQRSASISAQDKSGQEQTAQFRLQN